MYERQRDEFDVGDPAKRWGPGSGLHKSTDGGKTWKKLTEGLPTAKMGRIGIDYYRKDPSIVFAILETEQIGKDPKGKSGEPALMGISGEDGDEGAKLTRITAGGPAEKAGLKADDVDHSRRRQGDHEIQRPGGPDRRSQGGRQGEGQGPPR